VAHIEAKNSLPYGLLIYNCGQIEIKHSRKNKHMSSGIISKNYEYFNRHSIRLKGYDYTKNGAYFITICTHEHEGIFGKIENGRMLLNELGEIANACWMEIPKHFTGVELDEFIIMPNHIHGIIVVAKRTSVEAMTSQVRLEAAHAGTMTVHVVGADLADVGAKNLSPLQCKYSSPLQSSDRQRPFGTSKTIGSIIRGFKIGVTKWSRQNTTIKTIWQRNYYDRIIRDNNELNIKREYIINNPEKWDEDENNPAVYINTKANDDLH
jgi:putative transposase